MNSHNWRSMVLSAAVLLCFFLVWPLAVPGSVVKVKQKPLQIRGLITVSTNRISGEIALKEDGVPLSGAKVTIGKLVFSETTPGMYIGNGAHTMVLNTIVTLRVWRKPGPFPSLPGSADLVGTSKVRNWLTPLFPKQNMVVSLFAPIKLSWSFAGITEKSCLSLKGGGYNYWHCQTNLKHIVSTS